LNGQLISPASNVFLCLSGLLTSNQTANLLDLDQVEEIQANAAEALANITKVGYTISCALYAAEFAV
jgi:hypothetical protein